MHIKSRDPSTTQIGAGQNTLLLTEDELDLVSSFLVYCRLGTGSTYSMAAMDLMQKIEKVKGDDYLFDAAHRVDLGFSVEDRQGTLVAETSNDLFLTLEV